MWIEDIKGYDFSDIEYYIYHCIDKNEYEELMKEIENSNVLYHVYKNTAGGYDVEVVDI